MGCFFNGGGEMRFNKRITFVTDGESYYDPNVGDWVEGEKEYDTVPCNISTLKVDRTKQLFGEIDTNIQVVRLQRPYNDEFDYIELDGKKQKKNKTQVQLQERCFLLGK